MKKTIIGGILLCCLVLPVTTHAFSFGELQTTLRSLIVEVIELLRGQTTVIEPVVVEPIPTTATSTAEKTASTTLTASGTKPVIAPVVPPTTPTVTQTDDYTLSDIKSVTRGAVDPIPTAIDDEYTEYVITLKNGVVITVEEAWFAPRDMQVKAFRDSGYTGDIDALIKMAD